MIWRHPVAWLGLLTLLVPIVIHLLVRQQAPARPFPSLRFIQPSRLASVRRRLLSDWPLLLVRLALLALAVAALADPLWQSASRRAAWRAREARAIVVDTSPSAGATAERRRLSQQTAAGAFRSATFEAADLAEGIRHAADWLRTTPPAQREIALVSDFQIGALDAATLADVPASIGVRLIRVGGTPATRSAAGRPHTRRGATARDIDVWTPRVTVSPHDTTATWTVPLATWRIGIASNASAKPGAEASADAAPQRARDAAPNAGTTAETSADASAGAGRGATPGPGQPAPGVRIDDSSPGIVLDPFRVRLRASDADRPLVRAAAQAVLAQGVVVSSAPHGDITIAVARTEAGALPDDAARVAAPWTSAVLRHIATDEALTRAVNRARIDDGFPADVPAPWIVLMRDATGRPALLAAGRATKDAQTTDAPTKGAPTNNASSMSAPTASAQTASAQMENAQRADAQQADAELLLVSRLAAADEATALLIRATLDGLAGRDPLREAEVLTLPDAALAQWQRPADDPSPREWQQVESTDRRWLWGAVLALLGVEQIMRRRTRRTEAEPTHSYEHAA